MAFVKFIYSEKATKFCEISTLDLSYVAKVESLWRQPLEGASKTSHLQPVFPGR